jgi:hypothetical protein
MDSDFLYNTMTRVAGSWSSFGMAFLSIMNSYKWKNAVIISDTTATSCYYAAYAINFEMTLPSAVEDNMTIYWIRMGQSPTANDIMDYLRQIRLRSRGDRFFSTDFLFFISS